MTVMDNAGISTRFEFIFNIQLSLLPIIFSVPSTDDKEAFILSLKSHTIN